MDEFGYVDTCHFCDEEYHYCECEPFAEGFEFEGFTIYEPNVSVCGDRLVDPEVYYGEAYLNWANRQKPILLLDDTSSIKDSDIRGFFKEYDEQ